MMMMMMMMMVMMMLMVVDDDGDDSDDDCTKCPQTGWTVGTEMVENVLAQTTSYRTTNYEGEQVKKREKGGKEV